MQSALIEAAVGVFALAGAAYFITAGFVLYNRSRRLVGVAYAVIAVVLAWQAVTEFQLARSIASRPAEPAATDRSRSPASPVTGGSDDL